MANNIILYLGLAVLFFIVYCPLLTTNMPLPAYMAARDELIAIERKQRTGGKLSLSVKEQKVNITLMALKDKEYQVGLKGGPFPPAMHFFHARPLINKSHVFDIIKMMPKGAALHIHDDALVHISWVISQLTYLPNLYYCRTTNPGAFQGIHFSYFPQPPGHPMPECTAWQLVADAREQLGNATLFDEWLFTNMSMVTDDPHSTYPDTYKAWEKFRLCLAAVQSLIYSTEEYLKSYMSRAMWEFYDDNVQYMEIRFTPAPLTADNGTKHSKEYTFQKLIEVAKQFSKIHADFFGAKFITQSIRTMSESTVEQDIRSGIYYKKTYPDYYAGHDLVSNENTGYSLLHYIKELLIPSQENASLPFFFHAGETDWEGTSVDENLFDAILLNTSRIGHGYAITKHPVAMELVRKNKIPIEVNPISNQVLGLVSDLRNHPATLLLAQDFPFVISSDDPATWGALPMSHDFYQAFMGLAGKGADLATLKQLALNSIKYSATTDAEKAAMTRIWLVQWNVFLEKVIAKYGARYNNNTG